MSQASNPSNVVVDASFVVALCAREPGRYDQTLAALTSRTVAGCQLHAPHLLVMETLFALCRKASAGVLSAAEYAEAVGNLSLVWESPQPPSGGDASLIPDAERIRRGY